MPGGALTLPAVRSLEGFATMSVRDELSSEVAAALLETDGAVNARDLKDVLALFRTTLRALSSEEKGRRRARLIVERTHGLNPSANRVAN